MDGRGTGRDGRMQVGDGTGSDGSSGWGGAGWDDSGDAMSLRDMTLGALPHPLYGRMTVDVVTYGEFWGVSNNGGCQHQWGTSVACPVVVGVLAMLLSSVGEDRRFILRNPAACKQILVEAAIRLEGPSFFEQGMGSLSPEASASLLATFEPHVSSLPPSLNLTDCPFMSPYCDQPLHHDAMPLTFNLTLLNSRCGISRFESPPKWIPTSNGFALDVSFDWSQTLSPWGGYLGVRLLVSPIAATWDGVVEGFIEVSLEDDRMATEAAAKAERGGGAETADGGKVGARVRGRRASGKDLAGEQALLSLLERADSLAHSLPTTPRRVPGSSSAETRRRGSRCPGGGGKDSIRIPVVVRVVPTPPRQARLLFDLFHSSAYPNGFYPNDELEQQSMELMDWHGDHPYTNYRSLLHSLQDRGFFVEVHAVSESARTTGQNCLTGW